MKKHLFTIILSLVFIVGLSVLLYPTVSDYFIARGQSRVVAHYHEAVSLLNEEELFEMLYDAHAYNESLIHNQGRFHFSDDDLYEYKTYLNVSNRGVIGTLEIDFIDVSLPIFHGTSEAVLQVGVGHLEGSSLPVGGLGTHTVITGHRGLLSSTLLSNIDRMEIGDIFNIRSLGDVLTYQVDQILIVEPDDFTSLVIDPNMDYATLLTCTPLGINSHRLLVRGHRIENIFAARRSVVLSEGSSVNAAWVVLFSLIPATVFVILVRLTIFLVRSWKRGASI